MTNIGIHKCQAAKIYSYTCLLFWLKTLGHPWKGNSPSLHHAKALESALKTQTYCYAKVQIDYFSTNLNRNVKLMKIPGTQFDNSGIFSEWLLTAFPASLPLLPEASAATVPFHISYQINLLMLFFSF